MINLLGFCAFFFSKIIGKWSQISLFDRFPIAIMLNKSKKMFNIGEIHSILMWITYFVNISLTIEWNYMNHPNTMQCSILSLVVSRSEKEEWKSLIARSMSHNDGHWIKNVVSSTIWFMDGKRKNQDHWRKLFHCIVKYLTISFITVILELNSTVKCDVFTPFRFILRWVVTWSYRCAFCIWPFLWRICMKCGNKRIMWNCGGGVRNEN